MNWIAAIDDNDVILGKNLLIGENKGREYRIALQPRTKWGETETTSGLALKQVPKVHAIYLNRGPYANAWLYVYDGVEVDT